ncbi:hypothetical protein KBC04_02780 [Candidatus Babeliales bacterium]|nr:hypothetical protein [Candidatus Babeliales bacterium]MBP9844022.1 hypothetical protein [Candidatus Babeliales bacterium]
MTIRSTGKLGHLCAENIWGYGRECTTQKALEQCNDFDVTKNHGHYIFSRACKSDMPTNSSSVSSVVSSAIAQESLKRENLAKKQFVRDRKFDLGRDSKSKLRDGNLRGSSKR